MGQAASANSPVATVLIADDDSDVRTMMRTLLELDGFAVLEAADGEHAWETIQKDRPAVVIADIHMPGLDGLQLCRLVKANGYHETRVIAFTAGMATEEECRAAGCDGYFLKTDPLPGLRRAVRQALPVQG